MSNMSTDSLADIKRYNDSKHNDKCESMMATTYDIIKYSWSLSISHFELGLKELHGFYRWVIHEINESKNQYRIDYLHSVRGIIEKAITSVFQYMNRHLDILKPPNEGDKPSGIAGYKSTFVTSFIDLSSEFELNDNNTIQDIIKEIRELLSKVPPENFSWQQY